MENAALSWETTGDDDALLCAALAFIGDLEMDEGDLSPPSVFTDTVTCPPLPPASLVNGAFLPSLLAEPLGTGDAVPAATPARVAPAAAVQEPRETSAPAPLAWPTPAAVATTGINAAAPNKSNRSRTKRRDELLYLRQLVGDLESELTQVKRQTDAQQVQLELEKLDGEAAAHAGPSAMILSAWELVATRQYEQRQRSEMENIKLKRLLEEQIRVGKSLERLLLRKRPKLEEAETDVRVDKRVRHGSLSTAWDDTQIFRELLTSIEIQYSETPHVLANALTFIAGNVANHRNVELIGDDDLGLLLRTTESRILPFEYELVADEFWKSLGEFPSERITGERDTTVSGDISKVQFRANSHFSRHEGDLTVYMVDRRYREATRTVFVSSGFFDPTEISNISMDGVYMRHKGWVMLEPVVPVSGTTPTKASTRFTSYLIAVPEVYEGLEDKTRKVGALTNFVMGALSIELESRQQVFENRLFDRACKHAAA